VDRPPFTIWYHFRFQHAAVERTAPADVEFLDAYYLDWPLPRADPGGARRRQSLRSSRSI
jgi:hypothetical protein